VVERSAAVEAVEQLRDREPTRRFFEVGHRNLAVRVEPVT
jgi:hypothetical protein